MMIQNVLHFTKMATLLYWVVLILSVGFSSSSLGELWLQKVTQDFNRNISETVKESTAFHYLEQEYNRLGLKVIEINRDEIINTAVINLQKLFQTAESKVKNLTEEAYLFNNATNHETKLTNVQVRFYDKGVNETSATPNEVFKHTNRTLFYYNSKCGNGYQLPKQSPFSEDQNPVCYTPEGGFRANLQFNGLQVSTDLSAVHIPVDVYNEGSSILRDIAWTQSMDPVFKDHFCNNDTSAKTRWLYVATRNGVLRYFPSRQWSTPVNEIDLFDCRGESWFVQSMSSHKNVLIMIDRSGSVTGLTLTLIKMSVQHVMSSFSENDFFNVFVFNDKVEFLNMKCPGLMQGTPVNKEAAISWLASIIPKNPASFSDGFAFGFNQLNFVPRNASCNPIILLFTDGGAEYPEEVFNSLNGNKTTRVFTYSVGKHFASTGTLRQMACNNHGQFSTIPTDTATHFQTMKYLDKISKPLAIEKTELYKWSLPYEDRLGLGTVMTVTRPIYEDYNDNNKRKLGVLGVAAADILHNDIKQIMDVSQYGLHAYMFGTENNGFLFHHPLLRKGQLNAPTVEDLEDIEQCNMTELRKSMIDRESGEAQLSRTMVSTSYGVRHIYEAMFTYKYAPVQNSLFSVGLGIPNDKLYRIVSSGTFPSGKSTLSEINIADRDVYTEICGMPCPSADDGSAQSPCGRESSLNSADSASRKFECRSLDEIAANCTQSADNTRLDDLLLHGHVSHILLTEKWSIATPDPIVKALFVATDGLPSLLRIRHHGDEKYRQGIERELSNPTTKDYFQRAVLSKSVVYSLVQFPFIGDNVNVTTAPTTTVKSSTAADYDVSTACSTTAVAQVQAARFIAVSQPFALSTEPVITPVVSGALLDYDGVKEILFNLTAQKCQSDEDCNFYHSCLHEDQLCVVLDDAGVLVMTNQQENGNKHRVGKFFGETDKELMKALEQDGVYASVDIIQHQEVCKRSKQKKNSASRNFFLATMTNLLKLGGWFSSSAWLSVQHFLYVLVNFPNNVFASERRHDSGIAGSNTPHHHQAEVNAPSSLFGYYHCVRKAKVFKFGPTEIVMDGKADCFSCVRSYIASRISETNLLFVIANITTPCSDDRNEENCLTPYPTDELWSEVSHEHACKEGRYRKTPTQQCYDVRNILNNDEVNDADCGAAQLELPSVFFLVFHSVFAALFSGYLPYSSLHHERQV
ncbi:unnamed protein product [Clavelina lepadiformis]|uniref:VWFA domain-containing protein n=1 Tax=Clavelina lepadiformis TaxID=159417 RepID=A0ABP0GCU0_CLALP